MIELTTINLERDYAVIASWWEKRGLKLIPRGCFLPADGVMARNGEALAVSFLFTVPGMKGGVGVIEFTTTNPDASRPKDVLMAVKMIYAHLEQLARDKACGSVLALVVPEGSGEERTLEKLGYQDVGDGPHRTYGKVLWQSHS